MIIYSKQACEFRHGDERFVCPNGYIGGIPEWVAVDALFLGLCKDGKITVHNDSKGVDAEASKEEPTSKKKK